MYLNNFHTNQSKFIYLLLAHKLRPLVGMLAAVEPLMVDAPMVGVEAEYMLAAVVPLMVVDAVVLMAPLMVVAGMPPLMVVPVIVGATMVGQMVVALMAPPMVANVMPPLMVVLLMSYYVPHRTSCEGDDQASPSFPE